MRRRSALCLSPLFISVFLLISPAAVFSQTVDINGDNPKVNITVNAENAGISDILMSLANKFGFEISGEDRLPADAQVTTTFNGDLETILNRLLKNNSHLIIRSSKNASGIGKIVILKDQASDRSDDSEGTPLNLPSPFTRLRTD